jgi:hypothetical protein
MRKRRTEAAYMLGKCKRGSIEAAHFEAEVEMYDRAVTIWAAELGLFMQELREELATLLEQEFPKVSVDPAAELRADGEE